MCVLLQTLKAVKELYQTISTEDMQSASIEGYRYLSVDSCYGDVPQRWLVVYSQAASRREVATLEKKIAKAETTAKTSLKRLQNKPYHTDTEATTAATELSKSWKYHNLRFSKHYTTSVLKKQINRFRFGLKVKLLMI